jgi:hypothetical protein
MPVAPDRHPDAPPPAGPNHAARARPALACHVLRGDRHLPCLGVAELSPLCAAVLLGEPARPGEVLRLALVNHAEDFGTRAVLRVASCTPAPVGFLARGHFARPLDPVAWRLLRG